MKTLHFYVLRQAVSTLVMTICVFGFILLLGNVLKEILALLVNRQASLGIILKAVALLMPWIMAWVLPFALLTAMLLLFGRLSADNELTAVKASGISLLSLTAPLLVFAILMSGLCALFNLKVTPESRVAYKNLVLQLGLQNKESLITEDRFIDEIPNVVLYARKKNGDNLEDVCLYLIDKNTREITTRATAAKGRVTWDTAAGKVTFDLADAVTERLNLRQVDVREQGSSFAATNLLSTNVLGSMFTNAAPGRVFGSSHVREWEPWQYGAASFSVDLPQNLPELRNTKIRDMSFAELKEEFGKRRTQGIGTMPVLVQMHRQVAFSFAPFAFTLIAIPLGIRAHRRETSIGMAISLGLVVAYYSFLMLGEALSMRERVNPHLIVWIPNLLFQTLGAALLWRANRVG